jgi:putative DNA methylase
MNYPRLLIEEWLPAQAIGVECIRENSTGLHPPPNRLHVWWARRPLVVSRAAVLASLLPAEFDRDCFERLLGFYSSSSEIVYIANLLASKSEGEWVKQGHGKRAFTNEISGRDLSQAYRAMLQIWKNMPTLLDPMAGGGSIPFEAARLGLGALANEYNPVACSVLEATVAYPFQFGHL